MSRTPVLDATVAKMAELALTTGESLPSSITPDEAATAYLIAYTENGGRLSSLAQSLNVSRFLLQRWIWGDDERKQAYARARTVGAGAIVDDAGDRLDGATKDTIAVANAQANWRKWLAGKYDPATYGEGAQAPTTSALHLHYHAALQGTQPPPLSQLPLRPLALQSPPLDGSSDTQRVAGYPSESEAHPTESELVGKTEVVLPPSDMQTPPSSVGGE